MLLQMSRLETFNKRIYINKLEKRCSFGIIPKLFLVKLINEGNTKIMIRIPITQTEVIFM